MKSFTLLLFIGPLFAMGQITLNNPDFADGGDTVRMSIADDPAIDFASTGTNYTWDFSTLTPASQQLEEYFGQGDFPLFVNFIFGIFAPADYKATNFKSSTAIPLDQIGGFLPINISDINLFSKNSSDSITSVGFSIVIEGNSVPFKSDTIETRYKFPLTYGDSYASKGYTNLDMNPFYNGIWRQYRERNSNVDGWGSITTPYGTFDAIRIDHAITETDSLFVDVFGGFWVELPIPDSHQYEWWTNGELEPILRITTNDILGNEVVTKIEYRDNYLGLDAGIVENSISYTVYPNPATNEIYLNDLIESVNYFIVSSNGKVALKGNLSATNNGVDISSLSPGAYQFVIKRNDAFEMSTFVKN